MITGKAALHLRDGRRIPLRYEFGGAYDDTRAGYLLCDTTRIDAAALLERLKVVCDDGTELVAAVMHSSDRYIAVTGRVVVPEEI